MLGVSRSLDFLPFSIKFLSFVMLLSLQNTPVIWVNGYFGETQEQEEFFV
jgi:hypothetical protein